jgi:hypothetical protein
MKTGFLPYSVLTRSGVGYEMHFPLHPLTSSDAVVGDVLSSVLAAVGEALERHEGATDGDVLQALAMALAVRGRMLKVDFPEVRKLTLDLVNDAGAAANAAIETQASRA